MAFQMHDGLLDITNASDLVTVSWNRFRNHDKAMLIGSSDSASADRGKLRVTLHHNSFQDVGQRSPRVRFGQVHVYNNYFKVSTPATYQYSWGVGIESAIYAENNVFEADASVPPSTFIERFNGTAIFETGTLLDDGSCGENDVDLVAAWNAANDPPDLSEAVNWMPTLVTGLQAAGDVRKAVQRYAGPSGNSRR